MSPRSQQAIMVAAVAVGLAGVAGIAAIEGWVTLPGSTDPVPAQRPPIAASPAESLLPGETIVEPPSAPAPAPPAPAPPAPAAKPAPQKPSYAQAPAAERKGARRTCQNCGEVSSTSYRQFDRGGAWEVRVRFDDGTRATLRYPTDPGFRVGDRVVMSSGRLRRD